MHRRLSRVLAAAAVVALVSAPPAQAHEERKVGDHVFDVGWLEEPTYVGFLNAVYFAAAHGDEPAEGSFEVEVIFGRKNGETRTSPMPLEPIFGRPGEYQAPVVPTRPGTYTFHISGELEDGDEVDEFFTSGPGTFDEVREADAVQFPVQDPSSGELAEAVERLQSRVAELTAAIQEEPAAEDPAAGARLLAIVGIAIGGLGALIAIAALARGRSASR